MDRRLNEIWNQHTRHTFKRYEETLLRHVAHKLCKPRNQWPLHELLDRVSAALANVAMLDRRLKELPAECRRLLAAIGRSRQCRWPLGSLVELQVALGADDGLAPIVTLLESGLLLPELFPLGANPDESKANGRLRNFAAWLARSEPMPILLAPPLVTRRVQGEDLGIEIPSVETPPGARIQEADGLDWPLRVAVLWQQVLAAPVRRTQQGDYFKRDHERLKTDPLLSAPAIDSLAPIPDPGFFTAALALAFGQLRDQESELRGADWPAAWKGPLPGLLVELWIALLRPASWNAAKGHAPDTGPGNPYPSAYLLAMLLLTRLPKDAWTEPRHVEDWIAEKHPFWSGKKKESPGIAAFLLGIAYSLRMLEAVKAESGWLIRLSPLGRWIFGLADAPPTLPGFKQTLLVQPNLEILAYRQGLTPELIASLTKFAAWKTLGPACTLLLEPQSVYRALEMNESLASIVQVLEGHGMKAIPTAVLDSLKTWSSKRERISVYTAGAIFEFGSVAEMNDAIARGLPAVRLTDRLAIVANESAIEYKHFRLTGTRDYTLPPERCVDVETDGVTLSVDLSRSDLLLETELERFAEPVSADDSTAAPAAEAGRAPSSARRAYRVTPASILAARANGVTLSYLQTWFAQRTGLPISAAALLLMTGPDAGPIAIRKQLVMHVANEHLADGLVQWPGTRGLVIARLGPRALAVDVASVPALTEKLAELGLDVRFEE